MDKVDQVEKLRSKVLNNKGKWPEIARSSGVHYFTLVRFAHGTHDPRYSTVKKIHDYFSRLAA